MNIIAFSVEQTNVFPAANTTKGGQLLTEFNLRSRESIATDKNVQYMIGSSYAHSESDFYVRKLEGSSSIIQIDAGRGIVNGHFLESLTPIVIDLTEMNASEVKNGRTSVGGHLSIGLRAMYSAESTMAGSIQVENQDDMFEGIQVVILPNDEFLTPSDVPEDESKVTAHLLLATFDYYDGAITNVVQNYPSKCSVIDAWRIFNVDSLLTDTYLTKSGLNYKRLYTLAGKGRNNDRDTWCDSTGSLMVFDQNPVIKTNDEYVKTAVNQGLSIIDGTFAAQKSNLEQRYPEAVFESLDSGKVALVLPHQQIDYSIYSQTGEAQSYPLKVYPLPVADFTDNTSGTVDSAYTKKVKEITSMIENLYNLPNGKQRGYVSVLTSREQSAEDGYLPILNQSSWEVGDYILVGEDQTIDIDDGTTYTQQPSSIYVVLPGKIERIVYYDSISNITTATEYTVGAANSIPPSGMLLAQKEWNGDGGAPNTEDEKIYNGDYDDTKDSYFSTMTSLRGKEGEDYFAIDVYQTEEDGTQKVDGTGLPVFDRYYYVVATAGEKEYTDPPIWLTDEIPLAQTDRIGGFLNVEDTALDAGYVIRDDEGHLRILDYSLLRSGTLAYQLGENFESSTGLTYEALQEELDEYVNERVAFPNTQQKINILSSGVSNEINVTLHLSEPTADESSAGSAVLNLYGIDSRFNTHVNLIILGSATSDVTINIANCERIRIDSSSLSGDAKINVYNTCLYYDATILNRIAFGTIQGLSLWYAKRYTDDPDLTVDHMTVSAAGSPSNAFDLSFYADTAPNDNHFSCGLKSITFRSDGVISGCALLVKNVSASNVAEGKSIIAGDFGIPQGDYLTYPTNLLQNQIKVTGHFVSAYHVTSPKSEWMVQDTSFTALSQYYSVDASTLKTGTITFLTDAFYVENATITSGTGVDVTDVTEGTESIDGWEPDSYHIFYGGTLA